MDLWSQRKNRVRNVSCKLLGLMTLNSRQLRVEAVLHGVWGWFPLGFRDISALPLACRYCKGASLHSTPSLHQVAETEDGRLRRLAGFVLVCFWICAM